jgi:hypothetical protein
MKQGSSCAVRTWADRPAMSWPGYLVVVAAIMALTLGGGAMAGGFERGERVRGAVIHVPEDYSTIQAAIDNASEGQTIEVGPGIYDEAVFIDKNLTLVAVAGPGLTLIDAGGAVTAVSIGTVEGDFDPGGGIHPDFVRFEGFHVIGWTERGIAQRLGTGTVEIIGNQLTATEGDTRGAITISGGQDSRVEGNLILGTSFSTDGTSSTGIIAVGSLDAEIIDNQISGTDIGIALAAGFGNIDPSWAQSQNVLVEGNMVLQTDFGVAVLGSVLNAELVGNSIDQVTGRAFTVGDFDDGGLFAENLLVADNQAFDFGTRAYSSADRPVAGIEFRDNLFHSGVPNSWGIQLGNGTSNGLLIGNDIQVSGVALNPRTVSDVLIEDNDLTGDIAAVGMFLDGHSNNQFVGNRISGGVIMQDGANTDGYVFSGNQLLGGAGALGIAIAPNANFSSGSLAATCNWWDDPSGPSFEGTGQGSIVTEHVEFEPWNTAPDGPCDGDAAFADSLVAVSDTFLVGQPDTPLPAQDLPTVQVLDQYGNPFEGVTVTFELQASTGSITGDSQMSDTDGLAQLGSWMLGNEPEQVLSASATDLAGSPVTFIVNVDDIFHDRFEAP